MKDQFVTYEIALAVKELGFNEECLAFYYIFDDEEKFLISTISNTNSSWDNGYISAPLWQQVQSFLDDSGMIIGIIFVDNVFKYTLNIENYVSDGFKDRMSAIKSATEYATSYLWNKKFSK